LRKTKLTEFASSQAMVGRFLGEHRAWICSTLDCRLEDMFLLALDFPMVQAAVGPFLSGVRLRGDNLQTIRELRKLVHDVELPPVTYPTFNVRLAREPRGALAKREMMLEAKWQGGPAALRLRRGHAASRP
jgi:hypothetical protein